MGLVDIFLGRRLANREYRTRKIGAFEGIPAMGLDGLGSSAYGPEAALTVFIPLGAAGLSFIGWVMAPILGLLLILFLSYWQTVRAYPSNGGAYVVARDNLGSGAALLAAAALMIDYVLNVAVGISAGVGALVSAVPVLHPYILPICLGVLALVTVVNLRGTSEAGCLFALPTYLFVASFALIIGLGVWRALAAGGAPQAVVAPPALGAASGPATLWLLLRAFAGGCTAMTGVEAVSNGMSTFRDPPVGKGHRTLAGIVLILGALLAGVAYLATVYRIGAMDQTKDGYRSVLSQLAAAVVGQGVVYYVAIASLLCVLSLSANTSFVGFPRLCRMVAADGYLPKSFAIAGRRLVFSAGILYLAGASGLLLLVFGGITDRLIPLFAIGAFLTFTLSQAGMVVHWRRALGSGTGERGAHRAHLGINLAGAVTTGVALGVIVVAKFAEGAWITVLVAPMVILLLRSVRAYYDEIDRRLAAPGPFRAQDGGPPVILVVLEGWNRLAAEALGLALGLSPDVVAIHLTQLSGPEGEEHERGLHDEWRRRVEEPSAAAGRAVPRLVILRAQYRSMHEPVLKLAGELQDRFGTRRIAILIPALVRQRWYQPLLHTNRASHLRAQLLKHGGARLTVIDMPWHLDREAAGPEERRA